MTDSADDSPSGAAGPPTPEEVLAGVRAMGAGTLVERMGIEFVEASPLRLVATMPVAGNTQPYGLLHGGASAVLAETLGSVGAALHGAGIGRVSLGIEINATHHRAASSGVVTGVATPIHLGSTLASYEIVVSDDQGRRICTSRLTCMLRQAPPR
jgi:1,4-dihydroxy-2-naphthoyl-CoA hydrolase